MNIQFCSSNKKGQISNQITVTLKTSHFALCFHVLLILMVESLIYSSNFFLILHGFKFYTVLSILLYLSFYLVFWPNSTAKLWHTYIKYIYIYTLRIYVYFLIILNEASNNYEVLMEIKKLIHNLFIWFKFNFSLHFQL